MLLGRQALLRCPFVAESLKLPQGKPQIRQRGIIGIIQLSFFRFHSTYMLKYIVLRYSRAELLLPALL